MHTPLGLSAWVEDNLYYRFFTTIVKEQLFFFTVVCLDQKPFQLPSGYDKTKKPTHGYLLVLSQNFISTCLLKTLFIGNKTVYFT